MLEQLMMINSVFKMQHMGKHYPVYIDVGVIRPTE